MQHITFHELKDKLKELEETTLLELLEVTSEMLVEAFSDIIEDKQEKLTKELDD